MPTRLGFTDAQRKRLVSLGCEPEQIAELRGELTEIRRTLYRHAGRNDVKATLEAVATHAETLLKELGRIALQTDPARAEANGIIEGAYWREFPDDGGPWSAHHMLPRLDALAKGARDGIKNLPPGPRRHRTADPHPIARIHAALVYGWSKTHCRAYAVENDTLAEFAAQADAHPAAGPYPQRFDPSDAYRKKDGSGSVFREVAGICYEAAGSPKGESLRAIRAYLKYESERDAEALRRLNEVLGVPSRVAAPHRKNRTSRKS